MEGQQVLGGRYKLLNELGNGGMAVVWQARDEVLGRPVAVKLLAARYSGDPQSRGRIRDEARAAANLLHPNIAQVYDYGEATYGDTLLPYVVMELVNGPTLQQRAMAGPLPPRTIFRICGEVAAALAYAHAEGLVHRDIKMANIMVTRNGAKVVDFGIAAAIGPSREDRLLGTPAYLAPERLTGDAVTPASDVYALGVLLYRLLAGYPPWSVESTTQMFEAHIYVEPAPLPDLRGVPPAVAEMIGRCLRKDPVSRPTAGEVSSALADAAEAAPDTDGVRREPMLLGTPAVPAPSRGMAAPAPAAVGLAAVGLARSAGPRPSAAGGGGAPPVRPRKRRFSLVGGGFVGLLVAVLVAWFLISNGEMGREPTAAVTGSAPAVGGVSFAPALPESGFSLPSASELPSQPVSAGPSPTPRTGPTRTSRPPAGGAAGQKEDPPTSPPTSAPTNVDPPPLDPPPVGTRLTVSGGAVYATCSASLATLTGSEPAPGFTVAAVEPGPALTTTVDFAGSSTWYRATVTCVSDSPTAAVTQL